MTRAVLARDLSTPVGYFAAGAEVDTIARTDNKQWIVRLLPGWTVTLAADMLRRTRRATRRCITCHAETYRPTYCPDCEIIAVRMQAKRKAA